MDVDLVPFAGAREIPGLRGAVGARLTLPCGQNRALTRELH